MTHQSKSMESAKRRLFAVAAIMSFVFMLLALNGLVSLIRFLNEPDVLPAGTLTFPSGQSFNVGNYTFEAVMGAAVLIFAILPTCWIVGVIQRARRPEHCCEKCGYDIRASKDRCPECGSLLPVPNAAERG